MPAARRKTPKTHRDTTRALMIVRRMQERGQLQNFDFQRLQQILTDIDARETKRDPHLRRKT